MPTVEADNSLTNGRKANDVDLTLEEAKALHAKLNRFYRQRREGQKKQTPVLKDLGNVTPLKPNMVIQENPTDWDNVPNGALFAVDKAGSLLFTKVSKTRALCLNFMKTQPVAGASCYRIFI